MNLINGMENNAWGFAVALIISAVIAGCSWAVLRHKRLV
jgi:magnesium transporter